MFDSLTPLPVDPILGLVVDFNADSNPEKVDLGAGIYKDDQGHTPIMAAVQAAQSIWQQKELTKTYIGPAGLPSYNESMVKLLLGAEHSVVQQQRIVSVQTPGGCGALSVAANLINRCKAAATVWVSTPTWANHVPLLSSCGLQLKEYPYYDYQQHSIDFERMLEALTSAQRGDVVLLHGCCHNPSGADLFHEQWRVLGQLCLERGVIPFVDVAYQGLGDGLDEDAWGLRHLVDVCPEVIIATSCSKNFGLYRERVGSVMIVGETPEIAAVSKAQLLSVARGIYSMPPNHGAALVDIILNDTVLYQQWSDELTTMRERIAGLRQSFVRALQNAGMGSRFDYIQDEKGMFSFLGITAEQVAQLKQQYSIYMVDSSRINVAGLSHNNIDYVVQSLIKTIA